MLLDHDRYVAMLQLDISQLNLEIDACAAEMEAGIDYDWNQDTMDLLVEALDSKEADLQALDAVKEYLAEVGMKSFPD